MQRRRQGEEGQKWHRQQKRWRFIGSTNIIPSKLLIWDFHYIIKLIIVELRNRHKKSGNNGAGVFLVYLVREKLGCHGHTERWTVGFIFNCWWHDNRDIFRCLRTACICVHRAAKCENYVYWLSHNERNIPELSSVVLRWSMMLCEVLRHSWLVFVVVKFSFMLLRMNVSNFKQLADNNGLEGFVCPNWTKINLKALEHE